MKAQIVLCGLGGQGIVFGARVLAEAAIVEGRDVITSEVHGMAQRGGAVDSHVKIGGFESPLVRAGRADAVLAFDAGRVAGARRFVREGAPCFASGRGAEDGVRWCDAGTGRGANVTLLGFATAAAPALFPGLDALMTALDRLSPPAAREANRRAFLKGRELAT